MYIISELAAWDNLPADAIVRSVVHQKARRAGRMPDVRAFKVSGRARSPLRAAALTE